MRGLVKCSKQAQRGILRADAHRPGWRMGLLLQAALTSAWEVEMGRSIVPQLDQIHLHPSLGGNLSIAVSFRNLATGRLLLELGTSCAERASRFPAPGAPCSVNACGRMRAFHLKDHFNVCVFFSISRALYCFFFFN